MAEFDFANILFAGPCNRACPWCIGKQLPSSVNQNNLDRWPLLGLDAFVEKVNTHQIREIVTTGTVSDPQLYKYEGRLLDELRTRLHTGTRYSVHTNGVRALKKLDVFNSYDRACISFPSFEPATYARMMGSTDVPDLALIVERAEIPVKVSCVLDEPNLAELREFLTRCHTVGVRRVVVRKLFGESRDFLDQALTHSSRAVRDSLGILRELPVVRHFKGNPVMDLDGMEVTYWTFSDATCKSINLFADGTLGEQYLLTDTVQLRTRSVA